jgi:hypothetical protein
MNAIKYPDSAGYDAEGYGLQTGMHKNKGVRRHYRPLCDTPLTPEERQLDEQEQRSRERQNARQAKCTHAWQWHNHEEQICKLCHAVKFVPDSENRNYADADGRYIDRTGEPV